MLFVPPQKHRFRLIFCLHVLMLGVLLSLKSNCGPNYGSYDLFQRKPRTNFREIVLNHSQESFGAQCLARGAQGKRCECSCLRVKVSGARLALRFNFSKGMERDATPCHG